MRHGILSFFVSIEYSFDPLLLIAFLPKIMRIIIGKMKIQAFHKPNSKGGIEDIKDSLIPR